MFCKQLMLCLLFVANLARAMEPIRENIPVPRSLAKGDIHDPTDIYFSPLPNNGPQPVLILLQGARVDKGFYRAFGQNLRNLGIIVAIPNHNSLLGKNFTAQKVFPAVWHYLKKLSKNEDSALFEAIDPERLFVLGHSFGGVAAMGLAAGRCQLPTCMGALEIPEALKGVLVYGFYNIGRTENQLPVMMMHGMLDNLKNAEQTYGKISNNPKIFLAIPGANHYAITDVNNPAGAKPDRALPKISQDKGLDILATWTRIFIDAYGSKSMKAIRKIQNYRGTDINLRSSL